MSLGGSFTLIKGRVQESLFSMLVLHVPYNCVLRIATNATVQYLFVLLRMH